METIIINLREGLTRLNRLVDQCEPKHSKDGTMTTFYRDLRAFHELYLKNLHALESISEGYS